MVNVYWSNILDTLAKYITQSKIIIIIGVLCYIHIWTLDIISKLILTISYVVNEFSRKFKKNTCTSVYLYLLYMADLEHFSRLIKIICCGKLSRQRYLLPSLTTWVLSLEGENQLPRVVFWPPPHLGHGTQVQAYSCHSPHVKVSRQLHKPAWLPGRLSGRLGVPGGFCPHLPSPHSCALGLWTLGCCLPSVCVFWGSEPESSGLLSKCFCPLSRPSPQYQPLKENSQSHFVSISPLPRQCRINPREAPLGKHVTCERPSPTQDAVQEGHCFPATTGFLRSAGQRGYWTLLSWELHAGAHPPAPNWFTGTPDTSRKVCCVFLVTVQNHTSKSLNQKKSRYVWRWWGPCLWGVGG